MLFTLAFRHLLVRKRRALFLLLGFALGVGVMMVLLSVGEAMVEQSRDVSLVGGGEVTVLPQGIDVEALRTGGIGGMFFGIERARFVTRQLVGGPRERGAVAVVAPAIANKLLYLAREGDVGPAVPVRAAGEVPSRARAVGAGLRVAAGRWTDTPADSAWVAPTAQQLYDQLDRFHLPPGADSTWGEWHYFNVVSAPDEWWYLTFLVGGAVGRGRWGGQLLATHRRPDGRYERFVAAIPATAITLDTTRADLTLGPDSVRQRDGAYHVVARVPAAAGGTGGTGGTGALRVDLVVRPLPHRYFPPVELSEDVFLSGYVVPGLAADATGTLCVGARCVRVEGAPAYHDHNWGTWRGVTWEWGAARGAAFSLLYGGVYGPEGVTATTAAPFFVALVDSLGLRQVLRFRTIGYEGTRAAQGATDVAAPARFTLVAARESDTVRLAVTVDDALATRTAAAGFDRAFVQMRGRFTLDGRLAGAAVHDTGSGFFETYVRPQSPSRTRTPAVR
ncbi:MAG TPA: hypothetical protein VFS40_00365 [Gemmatimonadales bacterium]|nr:hypothetical protein [Gemmatimonadales bacterium]